MSKGKKEHSSVKIEIFSMSYYFIVLNSYFRLISLYSIDFDYFYGLLIYYCGNFILTANF